MDVFEDIFEETTEEKTFRKNMENLRNGIKKQNTVIRYEGLTPDLLKYSEHTVIEYEDETPKTEGKKIAWRLFICITEKQPDLVNFKLAAIGKVSVKANYWGTWSIKKGRFLPRRDLGLLNEYRPGLYFKLVDVLTELSK